MHIHLDLVGGLSGDMFIGAVLDSFPELAADLPRQLELAGFADLVTLSTSPANDGTLTGTSFHVTAGPDATGHHHRHFSEIRSMLEDSQLDPETRRIAIGIFSMIAEAEAQIHGTTVEKVAFHEVGAWDSIADVVCAAWLIATIGAKRWSVSKLPLGGGQVKTAHGMLPVPAPATALMLRGFEFQDDGVKGERITPTGAAILKFLSPRQRAPVSGVLARTGFGFGTRRLPGLSNVARLLVFEEADVPWETDQILMLAFEIDDQTPEELAVAVERLRAASGVVDVLQMPAWGKKGRQVSAVRVLARPERGDDVIRTCFQETTTLGVRQQLIGRSVLARDEKQVERDGMAFRVKVATRPGGPTAKVENDDLAVTEADLFGRRRLGRELEASILRAPEEHDD